MAKTRIIKRGDFYYFEFMESGVRLSGTFNGKTLPHASDDREAFVFAEMLRKRVRTEVRQGSYDKEAVLEQFAVSLGMPVKNVANWKEQFSEFFDRVYLAYVRANTTSWKHAQFRGETLKAFFGNKKFSEITAMLIVRYINMRLATKSKRGTLYDGSTINKEVSLLSSIFIMAMGEGGAKSNPCTAIPKVVRKRLPAWNKRERFLTEEEEERLFAQFVGRRAHLGPMIRFYLETGLRKSELCRVEVRHVNLSTAFRIFQVGNKRLEVPPGCLLIEKSKNGKPGIIPLNTAARQIAESQVADATTGKYLFTSYRTGGMVKDFKRAFTAAREAAGLVNFRLHDLRHTFGTRLGQSGADPFAIRDLMLHSDIKMTAAYTQTDMQQRQKAVERMAQSQGQNRNNVVDLNSVKITA